METALAAVGSVLPKLQAYLSKHKEEDHCSINVLERLGQELGGIHDALLGSASAHAPPGQQQQPQEEPAGAWAGEARELAYDVEDAVDDLLLATPSPVPAGDDGDRARATRGSLNHTIQGLLQRATDLSRDRPQTPSGLPASAVGDHPRRPPQQLPPDVEAGVVGVDDARDALIRRLRLCEEAGETDNQVKVVSVVGSVGLGKTTVAGAAYGVLKPRFDCLAFVSVGLDPDIAEVLESALRQVGVFKDADADVEQRDERLLISQLREFLQNRRYLIVLDDLWDKSSWEKIRSALADNNLGSRTVTTTHNIDLADDIGATYELKPLCSENSKKLFFRTVFGSEDKCSDNEFTELADKILEKCGAVPLAIITLAKMLAGNKVGDKREWLRVCGSISSTLENTPDVKNMRMAVSTGYYDLPPHLRACLLYMSIFPENFEIRRGRLIRWWIAEGFVQPRDEQGESLFDLGQSYFDELVNRGMIQFLDIDISDDVYRDEHCCSVNFPVMDFIRYQSSQENFVTILEGEQRALPPDMPAVLRVSIRGGGSKAEDSASLGSNNNRNVQQLRSLTVFSPATPEITLDLKMCKFLRVLDLEECDLSESELLEQHLGSLVHLRYLGLRETRISCVPEEISNLKFLQTLDLDENLKVFDLPASITRLVDLTCLRVSTLTRLPSGIGNLTALEELSDVSTRYSPELVKELGSLTRLRVLKIRLYKLSPSEEEAFLASLRNLRRLQTLHVYADKGDGSDEELDMLGEDAWAPPPCLVELRANALNAYWSPVRLLPLRRLDGNAVPNLAVLIVKVAELRQSNVDALGTLPALRVLRLEPYNTLELIHVSGGRACFPRLTECRFRDADVAPVFRRGAMPRLRRLEICFNVRKTIDLGNTDLSSGWRTCSASRRPPSTSVSRSPPSRSSRWQKRRCGVPPMAIPTAPHSTWSRSEKSSCVSTMTSISSSFFLPFNRLKTS